MSGGNIPVRNLSFPSVKKSGSEEGASFPQALGQQQH